MEPIIVIEQVAILAVLMAVGYVGGKFGVIKDNESKAMTTLLTNVALPALILSAFSIGYSQETLRGVITIFIFSFGAHVLSAVIGKIAFVKYGEEQNKVLRFGNIFANSGFMGVPFVFALFGEKALLYGSVFTIPFHILMWTYGEPLIREEKEKLQLKKMLKNPAIVSIIVGLIIFIINIPLPNVVDTPISMLSSLTLPLAMMILGERISHLRFKEIIVDKNIYYASFIKLIVVPIATLLVLKPINIDPLVKNIIVVMQSLPIAVLTVVLAEKHNSDVDLASKTTVVSHIFSVVTIPLIALLL